jgi:hypothetical protein
MISSDVMSEDRRSPNHDRRKRPRGGRRPYDNRTKPWYMRRRLWLAAASLLYVGWQRMRTLGRRTRDRDSSGLAA